MTAQLDLFAAFLIGIAGGVHCFGMCGGITVALQSAVPNSRYAPVYTLAYHSGRIASYTVAGALTGWLGSIFSHQFVSGIHLLTLLSAVLLILLGLYIGDWFRGLAVLERAGGVLWRRIQPFATRLLPFKTPVAAVGYGAVWGWLPCGLVYSTLSWSLASGTAGSGALVMLAFGLGTLPAMLTASFGYQYLRDYYRHPLVRQGVALMLLCYGLYLFFQGLPDITH
ncbi:sulfite exporter TauE/SafE family protein [Alteromonas oceanisediminis]|uniref:sulfite exporter TauE/SafE family protein n=1 Tax=Alteromonas oceanisediminis TaxID=2836180 RepID=UPI001BD98310|nr:sulfite exporter TauE/SafE family protein [Alteromonas oceanisediminis]MBT0586324.1 sulfite exporter TauE/SafE family protein [Alteromonas oceanisediminis]